MQAKLSLKVYKDEYDATVAKKASLAEVKHLGAQVDQMKNVLRSSVVLQQEGISL